MPTEPNRTAVNQSVLIDIDALHVGMFIELESGWFTHPFPMSRFRISSVEQIHVLRKIGLKSVRYVPAKSSLVSEAPHSDENAAKVGGDDAAVPVDAGVNGGHMTAKDVMAQYQANLENCQQRFAHATGAYCAVAASVRTAPQQAREQAQALIDICVEDLLAQGPCAVHLLINGFGQRSAVHAVNVMALALLLGQSLGLQAQELQGLGVAALLHDLGKVDLPRHIGEPGAALRSIDRQRYQGHVGLSVELGRKMGLPGQVLIAIAQHHEMADGSGFPQRLMADGISRWGQILALVNRYDRLCNPLHGEPDLTPHEAVARLFALQRECFDATVLAAFIRMMGVYPPGSLVQLADGRFAVVAIVDSSHPLRPCVVPYQPDVLRAEARLLNLAQSPELGILRSLKPGQLPRDVLDFLLPQPRVSYFFERAPAALEQGGGS